MEGPWPQAQWPLPFLRLCMSVFMFARLTMRLSVRRSINSLEAEGRRGGGVLVSVTVHRRGRSGRPAVRCILSHPAPAPAPLAEDGGGGWKVSWHWQATADRSGNSAAAGQGITSGSRGGGPPRPWPPPNAKLARPNYVLASPKPASGFT